MGLKSRLAGAWAALRAQPPNPRQATTLLPIGANNAGVVVTPETAMAVSAFNACVDVIASPIAASDWCIYEVLQDGDREARPQDPLYYTLNVRPNPDMTALTFRRTLLYGALIWGNGYAEIVRDGANRVVELWPIYSERVEPFRADGVQQYAVQNNDGSRATLGPNDMLHIRGPSVSGFWGDNTITRAARTIALAAAQQRFAEAYFGNNTQLGGIIEVAGQLDDPTYERLKKAWEERHKGPSKAHRIGFLEGGMKWHGVDINAEKSQLTTAMQHSIEEICRFFKVPPHKVQHLLRATFNNIEHLGIEFVRDCLRPWARELQQEAEYKLLSNRGPKRFTIIDLDWASQGDFKSRAEAYQIMRNIGVLSANDILRKEGQNTIGTEGDTRIVNGASIPLEKVGENYENKKTPDAPKEDPAAQGDVARDAYADLFTGIYDRLARCRANARADMERKGRDDIDAAMQDWSRSYSRNVAEAVLSASSRLSMLLRRDVSALAVTFGRKVVAGELEAATAAVQLIESTMGPKA